MKPGLFFLGAAALVPFLGPHDLPNVPLPMNGNPDTQEAPSSQTLFTIPEHDLYPENIAFDPASGDYFLSSMGQSRILRIHADGSYEDFARGLEPELLSSVGMKVDAQRRRLWVCSGRWTLFGGAEGPSRTGVLLFDLDDGTLLRSWLLDQPDPGHIFNDLALDEAGRAYVTTTLFGRVYRVSPDSEEMDLLLDQPGNQANGITLGPRGRYLFFTLDRTISRMDLETGEVVVVPVPDDGGVGTDGLYFVDGALVALQPRRNRVVRLHLNAALDAVDRTQVLVEGDPGFRYPTTGVVVGKDLVFVATSYADVPRNPDSERQHDDVLIYRLPLSTPDGGPP